jgi:hypothetical protein
MVSRGADTRESAYVPIITKLFATVLRFLPALLALGLPFATPHVRAEWSAVGAGWLDADPASYRARALSLVVHCPQGRALAPGDVVPISDLPTRRQSTSDRLVRLAASLDDLGRLSILDVDREYEDRLRAFRVNTVIGALVAACGLLATFRLRGDLLLELRPWTR